MPSRTKPPSSARPDAPAPQTPCLRRRQAGSRLRSLRRGLRRSVATFGCTSEPAPFEAEFEFVAMFALTGMAFSLYLAASIQAAGGYDGLTEILTLLS
ncbi:MAG TPA: hypothetical protein VJ770_21475 [Stellaceae bacterium]|nr:hypothetical protein [Stellaceae bacterium]